MTAVAPKMDAMSRALGAAFLNHQVEKLEQTVSDSRTAPRSFSKKSGRAWSRPEEYPRIDDAEPENITTTVDASVIVVDSSVLIHSLSYLNNILHPRSNADKRSPIVVVPLEALNTLDLLKKGSSQSAKKAREASRLLEREVGENPLLRVQGDRDYVTWNMIDFDAESEQKPDPEWMRRALCCAAWEVRNTKEDTGKVVVAVCTPPEVTDPGASLRQEYRAAGVLMAHWARKATMDLVEVPMDSELAPRSKDGGRSSSETERERPVIARRGRGGSRGARGGDREFTSTRAPVDTSSFKLLKPTGPPRTSTSPKAFAPTAFLARGNGGHHSKTSPPAARSLVEKPPAIAPKVIRVLARGEKLD